jgi:hypothetical protein
MPNKFHIRQMMITAGLALGLTLSSMSVVGASGTVAFYPQAHKAALLRVLGAHAAAGSRINELRMTRSPLNSTWVYYKVGLHTSGGEDLAEGFAHWANGTWLIVYGPWSVECGPLASLTKIPLDIRRSFASACK